MTQPRATEAECEDAIIAAAKLAGWRVHAERHASVRDGKHVTPIKGHKGWPDLVLVRGREVWFVELKRKPNKVEPEQHAWLNALECAGVRTAVVWVPEQMQAFIALLTRRAA